MTLSGKVSLKVKMTILIIEILIIGSYGVVVGDKNMGAIRNDAIASMEEYVSEEHPEYSQEEIQQELQPILQKMQQKRKQNRISFSILWLLCVYSRIYGYCILHSTLHRASKDLRCLQKKWDRAILRSVWRKNT